MSAIIAVLNINVGPNTQVIRKEKQSKKQKSLLEDRGKKVIIWWWYKELTDKCWEQIREFNEIAVHI